MMDLAGWFMDKSQRHRECLAASEGYHNSFVAGDCL
jgi:hypothetical protein